MDNLLYICDQWGVKIKSQKDIMAGAIPPAGLIYLSNSIKSEYKTAILAHEMGHIYTYMAGGSEKRFPHLRLFRRKDKHNLKSNKYKRSLLAEEKEAWNIAEGLIKEFEKDYNMNLFYELKKESLKSYGNE